MATQVFINIPVADLPQSMSFFKALGYHFNDMFTDETAACLVLAEGHIHAMLLTHAKFKEFTPGTGVCDTSRSHEALICLTCESREQVDGLVTKAVAAGGRTFRQPEDHGFMYGHSFADLDGHVWELIYMDPQGPQAA